MIPAASNLHRLTDLLLDRTQSPAVHREATQAWYSWAIEACGMGDDHALLPHDPLAQDQMLPSGKAISPLGAARCVVEYQRTAVFLRAMDEALQAARARFPGETIHVLEAGCGPLAPLTLPFALRYRPDEVVFALLDIREESLACARQLAEALGVRDAIRAYRRDDAATVQFAAADRPHVIACEVLLAALAKEPQVAVTMNLASQLRSGGIFLPERIEVGAALFDSHERFQPLVDGLPAADITARGFTEIGSVFTLDPANVAGIRIQEGNTIQAGVVRMPPHDHARTPLHLTTRIRVFGEHTLDNFDSSLNLPRPVKYSRESAATGGELDFIYELSATPGLRVRSMK
jgi:predicted RNA methylase